jgi:hypothetical protein
MVPSYVKIYLLNIHCSGLDYINPLFLFSYPFDKTVNIHADQAYTVTVELINDEEFIRCLSLINLSFDLFL